MSSMTNRRPLLPAAIISLILAGLFVLPSCAEPKRLPVGLTCDRNSQCAAPLVCRLEKCRIQCGDSRDCPSGLKCVLDSIGLGACTVVDETGCTLDSDCPADLSCASGQCTNECADIRDCVAGASCEEGVCRDDIGAVCVRESDCTDELQCVEGRCISSCGGDRDCRTDEVCDRGACVRAIACTPGRVLRCACPDGRRGAQLCASDGSRYGACSCDGSDPVADAGRMDTSDGGVDSSMPDTTPPVPDAPILTVPANGHIVTGSPTAGFMTTTLRVSGTAERHEIEVQSRCEMPNYAACDFAGALMLTTPESESLVEYALADLEREGSVYVWRARGCNGEVCGDWSAPSYFWFGRQPSDVDGDFGDPVISSPGAPTGRFQSLGFHTVSIDGEIGAPLLGSLATDDFLASDGYGDVAIGIAGDQVRIFPGGVGPISATVYETFGVDSAGFGRFVARAEDPNEDGVPDLIVFSDEDAFASFFSIDNHVRLFTDFAGRPPLDASGTGDVNGDGVTDIAISRAGVVEIYFGGPTADGAPIDDRPDVTVAPSDGVADEFGATVELVDLDRDGVAELVVGAPNTDVGRGEVRIYLGGGRFDEPLISRGPEGRVNTFGSALAAGDLSGDGWPDVVVGAGSALYLYANILTAEVPLIVSDPLDARFVVSVSVDYLDADQFADVLVGNPVDGAGSVVVFRGPSLDRGPTYTPGRGASRFGTGLGGR